MGPNKTIKDYIRFWGENQPEKIFIYFHLHQYQLTYGELFLKMPRYRNFFERYFIKEGDIFACALNNSIALVELVLASYYNNRVVVPLNLVAGNVSYEYILKHCSPKVIFCNQENIKNIASLTDIPTVTLQEEKSPIEIFDYDSNEKIEPQPTSESSALLMYTSGTTGSPKGVLLSHKNLLSGGKNTQVAHMLKKEDVGLCVLPLYHINAHCVSLLSTIYTGATLILCQRFSVKTFFQTLEQYKISWASLVPTMFSYLLQMVEQDKNFNIQAFNLQNLQFLRSASAPLPIEVHQSFEKLLEIPIIETMGITEGAAQVFSNPRPPAIRKIGSVGLPYGIEVKIVDKQLNSLPINTEGEICIKGDSVMKYYYANKKATKSSFTADGWYRCGDLGTQDEDGYIRITGRIKELIIKGGENIAPREIDEILYSHPAVIEAAAFGCTSPHYGQDIEACVKVDKPINKEELLNLCILKLGKFKSPNKIHFLEELPKGPSGKIQRLKLEDTIYPK